MRIELVEAKAGDSIYADFIKEHGYGVHHFGILIEDMNTALAQAHSAGCSMIQDGHYAYLESEEALGVTLELIQRPKARVQPEKIYPPGWIAAR
jgi:4-hydroxyphenylpyruvate dioxygenase-like putative hemolysin